MKAKTTLVTLEYDSGVTVSKTSLEITHAERVLRMKNNGGWKLPNNSLYTFSEKDGLRFKSNTGKVRDSQENVGDQQSDQPSEQD